MIVMDDMIVTRREVYDRALNRIDNTVIDCAGIQDILELLRYLLMERRHIASEPTVHQSQFNEWRTELGRLGSIIHVNLITFAGDGDAKTEVKTP